MRAHSVLSEAENILLYDYLLSLHYLFLYIYWVDERN